MQDGHGPEAPFAETLKERRTGKSRRSGKERRSAKTASLLDLRRSGRERRAKEDFPEEETPDPR